MSLNTSRSLRMSDASGKVTTGKRGRPESLVRDFWEDIDTPGVGPKCVFCDHRSVTKTFRAPPATRHTLICKNAPEDVKARLRRATNNKYSRRPPSNDASVSAVVAAARSAQQQQQHQQQQQQSQPHHQVQQSLSVQQQQHVQHQLAHQQSQTQPHHSPPPPPQPQAHRSSPQQRQQQHHQYAYKPPVTTAEQHHEQQQAAMQSMQSPRHISAGVVAGITVPSPNPMHSMAMDSVVPMRSTLLNDRTRAVASHTTVLSPGAELLYPNGQRILQQHEDVNAHLDRANAALAAAVNEALFSGTTRKKEGTIPTPAEFRAALQDMKDAARVKAKRQRDEARAEVARLKNAISFLVQNRPAAERANQAQQPDSDDSDEELPDDVAPPLANARRPEWQASYERK